MEIYLYSRCSTCRDAERFLAERGTPFHRRDFFRDRFTGDELAALLKRVGLTPQEALSRRSRAYKQLGPDVDELTDDQVLALMVNEPTLLRRPLIVAGDEALIGFDRQRLAALAERS